MVDADAAERELHGVRLADEHHAGCSQPPHDCRVVGHDVPRQESRARRCRQPRDVVEILHRVGNAVQRPEVVAAPEQDVGGLRLGQRALPRHRDEGVQGRVQGRYAIEGRLGQLHRVQRAGTDLAGQVADRREFERRLCHHSSSDHSTARRGRACLRQRRCPPARRAEDQERDSGSSGRAPISSGPGSWRWRRGRSRRRIGRPERRSRRSRRSRFRRP